MDKSVLRIWHATVCLASLSVYCVGDGVTSLKLSTFVLGSESGNLRNHVMNWPSSRGVISRSIDESSACDKFINDLSRTISNYTDCVVQQSYHSLVCMSCVTQYLAAHQIINNSSLSVIQDGYHRSCADRLSITEGNWMLTSLTSFLSNWDNLYCSGCFVSNTSAAQNDLTIDFFLKSRVFYDCAANMTQQVINEPFAWVKTDETVNNHTCKVCGDAYKDLTEAFMNIEKKYDDKVCEDISDVMNFTRWLWSDAFHCHLPHADILPLMLVSCFLAILPITFYIASYLNGTDVQKNILPEKRLRSNSIVATSTAVES